MENETKKQQQKTASSQKQEAPVETKKKKKKRVKIIGYCSFAFILPLPPLNFISSQGSFTFFKLRPAYNQ